MKFPYLTIVGLLLAPCSQAIGLDKTFPHFPIGDPIYLVRGDSENLELPPPRTRPIPQGPTSETLAVLEEGPTLGRGLPYLSPNAIPYVLGRYRYRDAWIEVYFIRAALPVLESWIPIRCGVHTLYQITKEAPEALIAISPLGFSLLIILPQEPWRCLFVEPFIARITRFYQSLGSGESPLPALIETK